MDKILTCGELNKVTFETYAGENPQKTFMSSSDFENNGSEEIDSAFGIRVHKKTKKQITARDKSNKETLNNELRIKHGARVLKIDNVDDYNEMVSSFTPNDKLQQQDLDGKAINFTKEPNAMFSELSKEYDGVYITDKVIKELGEDFNHITGGSENLKILNSDIITTPDDKSAYKRNREGKVKGSAKTLTETIKVSSFNANKFTKVLNAINGRLSNPFNIFKRDSENVVKGEAITKIKNELQGNKIFKNLKIIINTNNRNTPSREKDSIHLNNDYIIKKHRIANILYKTKGLTKKISIEDSTKAYALYEAGKMTFNNKGKELEKMKTVLSNPYKNFNNSTMVDSNGNIVIPKSLAVKYSKEKLYNEKLAWEFAARNDKDNEAIKLHSSMELSKHIELHNKIKNGELDKMIIGDKVYTIHDDSLDKKKK